MYHSFPRAWLYSAYKLTSHFLDCGKPKKGSGTCFFVRLTNSEFVLVSNRHVLDPEYEKPKRKTWQLGAIEVRGFSHPDFAPVAFILQANSEVVFPEAFGEDVAAIKVSKVQLVEGGPNVGLVNFELGLLASDEYFAEIHLTGPVGYPGYPEWHDQEEGRPIMRRGTIASDPTRDYRGPNMKVAGRIVAYEAFSFQGSSGSPVCLPEFGVTLSGEPGTGNHRPAKLIGVNSGHLVESGTGYHSGISYFFKSTVILDLIARLT